MRRAQVLWMVILLCLISPTGLAAAEDSVVVHSERRLGGGGDADFNGDGFADVAIAEVFAVVGDGFGGAVHVMYGSVGGLTGAGSQYWTENRLGGEAHRWDYFGGSLATGDFDGDHFSDLAIGIPQAELDPPFGDEGSDHGMVRVVYGSPVGLSAARSQLWSYGRLTGGPDRGFHFGSALAAGNFGKGQQDDLAVSGAGTETVAVLYGGASGLAAPGHQLWSQDSRGIKGRTQRGEEFGFALAVGHLAGRVYADLAIGVPNDRAGSVADAGSVNVLYGSASGLTPVGDQIWHQGRNGIAGAAEPGDGFGGSLATGKLAGRVNDDLAIGVIGESIGGRREAGAVNVLYGSSTGLSASGNQLWSQSSRGVPGVPELRDGFVSLAIGNFGRDLDGRAYADLAIGAAGESVGRVEEAGSVTLIYGSSTGLSSARSHVLTQATLGVPGRPEEQDFFGTDLAAANFGNDSAGRAFDDLVVSAPYEGIRRSTDADGTITVAYGGAGGLSTRGCEAWYARKLGHPDTVDGGTFGSPLSA